MRVDNATMISLKYEIIMLGNFYKKYNHFGESSSYVWNSVNFIKYEVKLGKKLQGRSYDFLWDILSMTITMYLFRTKIILL